MSDNHQLGWVLRNWARLLDCIRPGWGERLLKRSSPSLASSTSSATKSDGWSFTVRVDGDDLVCDNCTATWFGGANDELDNGQTASGISTLPDSVLGCALPVVPSHPSTAGSPLAFRPRIPWKTLVEVTYKGKTLTVPLIDNGPAKSAGDAIDLTIAVFKQFAPLKVGVLKNVSFRVLGVAHLANARTNIPTPG